MNSNVKSIKMRTMPIGKLLAAMSLPAIFSMFVQAMYNVVDTMYISRYDIGQDNMITALGYAFPMQMIMMALSLGIGIGCNILISRKLGERKPNEASNIARTGIIMAIIAGLMFLAFSFFLPRVFLDLMSNIEIIKTYGVQYLSIIMMFSVFIFIEISVTKMLQGMGRMLIPMIAQLIGAITNIILDPIFIFTLDLGVTGAAIATIIGQAAAMLFAVGYIILRKVDISFNFKNFKFKGVYVKEITRAGLPAMVMNSVAAFTNIILNNILKALNPEEIANAVLTIYFKLQSFVFMPIFGLTQGGLPILSYNFGANVKKRFITCAKILISVSLTLMTIGFLLFQIFPKELLDILGPEPQTIALGIPALRIISFAFFPAAFGVIMISIFQSIDHGSKALIMSLLRQAAFLVPLAFILGKAMGIEGVWLSFPIAEALCLILFAVPLIKLIKQSFARKDAELLNAVA
ncbi:MAG: MATE family efflux transporter [Bacilli bacterium]|jgi:putative MATE family efflux protein|nr:MATE family efflux transporter [Bacilli bacterium]MDD3348116.1 MATE family efflux transporter [Bacilli bacterium]MDD4056503.1 MATE family efflux transporter [Bacilli bacterium]MDY0208783.1 MATE family efflux transporter [Bacilli bacterium]